MIYGWDVSTSIIGLAMFEDDGKFVKHASLDMRKIDGQIAKTDAFKTWITKLEFVNSFDTNFHFVEERLGGFSGGRTSTQVLMKLAQINALISYVIWMHNQPGGERHDRQISYIHPMTWKSLLKKEGSFAGEKLNIPKGTPSVAKKQMTLEFVLCSEPSFHLDVNKKQNPQPWMFDEADAYCIGRAGWLQMRKKGLVSFTQFSTK